MIYLIILLIIHNNEYYIILNNIYNHNDIHEIWTQ